MKLAWMLTLGLSVSLALPAFAQTVPKLRRVSEGIYRSGRADEKGFTELVKTKHIKTVINLENVSYYVNQEAGWAKKQNVVFYSFPTSAWAYPNDAKVDQILNLMADPENYPILIHCQHGEDRSGLMVGLFRVYKQGWTPEAAYTEMLNMGFHKLLFVLNHYYEEKTGFED
jgi:protein tyrosine/serine phosphatase